MLLVEPELDARTFLGPHLVVVLDDDPRVLAALRRVFREESLDLLASEGPRQALEWIRARPVSLVITDQRMPEMTGVEFLDAVRKCSPETACLMLTAYPESVLAQDRGSERVPFIIAKPWDDAFLRQTVRALLEGRERPVAPEDPEFDPGAGD